MFSPDVEAIMIQQSISGTGNRKKSQTM